MLLKHIEKPVALTKHVSFVLYDCTAIDLVMGGPPCIDYSLANAHREGINGAQGSYMPRFGTLIQKIQRIQPNHHVFFLAENTILRNDKELNLEEGDLECIKESFGVQWVMDVDASYFTPGRRNRTYISNIPLLTKTDDYILDEELVDSPYLTDDFVHCAHYMCDHMKVPRIPEKVACLLASKSRIDKHPTMSVVKTSKGDDGMEYKEHRPLNIKEREAVMGFPVGYVEDAGTFGLPNLSG
jgi:C-5 cytosine-specific DNA methylase